MVQEPGFNFLDHAGTQKSTSKHTCNDIIQSLKDKDILLKNLTIIGCDGTSTNTEKIMT